MAFLHKNRRSETPKPDIVELDPGVKKTVGQMWDLRTKREQQRGLPRRRIAAYALSIVAHQLATLSTCSLPVGWIVSSR
jgi:hypothetical protein